jgi:hypothetical protein
MIWTLDGIYLPMQLTDWLLIEVALLLIGLTQTSKIGFDRPGRDKSFRPSAAFPLSF